VSTSKGMVQVSGKTYRIVERGRVHDVVRLEDDHVVGTLRHHPLLEVVASELPRDAMWEVAMSALRGARLPWGPRSSSQRTLMLACSRAGLEIWRWAAAAFSSLLLSPARLRPVPVLAGWNGASGAARGAIREDSAPNARPG
jgi:hypothetical protein